MGRKKLQSPPQFTCIRCRKLLVYRNTLDHWCNGTRGKNTKTIQNNSETLAKRAATRGLVEA